MATTFPDKIQTFPEMLNITPTDGNKLKAYQEYMLDGRVAQAQQLLRTMDNWQQKIITANYLNTLFDTCEALQEYYTTKYSPAYVVSAKEPINQEPTDFWFKITGMVE